MRPTSSHCCCMTCGARLYSGTSPDQSSAGKSHLTGLPKPMEASIVRSDTCLSNPTNAPPQMNRMLLVSTCVQVAC